MEAREGGGEGGERRGGRYVYEGCLRFCLCKSEFVPFQ